MPDDENAHPFWSKRRLAAGAKTTLLRRLGKRLRLARNNSGLTQSDVAERLGTTAQTVRNWETGRHEPSPNAIKKLVEIYSVSENTLLEDLDPAIVPRFPKQGFRYDRVVVEPERLVQARTSAGLSQQFVAEMTGLSLSAIRRYENGSANPATRTLEVMATIYHRPAGWFTTKGHFTEDEISRFAQSVITTPERRSHDELVMDTYQQAKSELSDEAKLRIANFIRFTLELDRSGQADDFFRFSIYNRNQPRFGAPDGQPQDDS